MEISKKTIYSIILFAISLILLSYLSALSTLFLQSATLDFIFGQIALAFLVNKLLFPHSNNRAIAKNCFKYLGIVIILLVVLSLLPSAYEESIFIVIKKYNSVPTVIKFNSFAILISNISAILFVLINDKLRKAREEKVFFNYKKLEINHTDDFWDDSDPEKLEIAVKSKEMASELKEEVNEIFDLYLEKFEESSSEEKENLLESLEDSLVKHISPQISEALCLDENWNKLEESLFKWESFSNEELKSFFEELDQSSQDAGTGKLCQTLIENDKKWYLIAKYRGIYLILKSRNNEFADLLEISYKVFKTLG